MAGSKTWADGDGATPSDFNGYFRDQVITICTSGTRPTTSQDGRPIFETDTNRYYRWSTGSSSWVWTHGGSATWSPTWTNLSVGDGTWSGSYTRAGDLVVVHGLLIFGTTTSVTGLLKLTVPVAPTQSAVLTVGLFASASAGYTGFTPVGDAGAGSTTGNIVGPNATTAWAAVVPEAWATGFRLWISGSYLG